MVHRRSLVPRLASLGAMLAGILFILIPNVDRGREYYRGTMEGYGWSRAADLGVIESVLWTVAAIIPAAGLTVGTAVVEHPVLTVLFGFGLLLLGIVLLVEYGLSASETERRRTEFEM